MKIGSDIGAEGMTILGEALKTNTSLVSLNLRGMIRGTGNENENLRE